MARQPAQPVVVGFEATVLEKMREELENALAAVGLFIMGHLPDGENTRFLIGCTSGFWPHFAASPEFTKNVPDPLDRWSERVVGDICRPLGAQAHFPSDGPPYPAFLQWAKQSGAFFQTPLGMLIHQDTGLMISMRAAVLLPLKTAQAAPQISPCTHCLDKPCLSACPVAAFSQTQGYDVQACKAHLRTKGGNICFETGCLARAACPLSQKFARTSAQNRFHMRAFAHSETTAG